MIEPDAVTNLAAEGLRVWTISPDGEERPVLLIADGEAGFLITSKSGTVEAAILGFERLESAAKEIVQELRQHGSNGRTTGAAHGDEWWSQSASGSL